MRIAIVGAEGQLGQDLLQALASFRPVPITHPEMDIGDRSGVLDVLGRTGAEWVVNCASMTHVDLCESEDELAFRVNALGARHISEACRDTGSKLVLISTDYVFDGKKRQPYIESDPTAPVNVYGITKLAGELYTRNTWPEHYIIRTSGLYGTHRCRGKGGNFPEKMLETARAKGALKVVADEVLTPTFTEDLARQIRVLIDAAPPFGVYHATNAGECSWYEFAVEVFRLAGLSVRVEKISSADWKAPARRPAYSVLENAALKAAGLDAMPEWRDALARYLRIDAVH